MVLLNHIMVALILIAMPIASIIDINNLKKKTHRFGKEKTYFKIFVWYCSITIGFIVFSNHSVFFIDKPLTLNTVGKIAFILAFLYFLMTQLIPIILLSSSKKFRSLTAKSFEDKAFIYPTTDRQKQLFWIVPITVGICEEIIFRGYLYQYFQDYPYNLSAIGSFLLACVIFGIGHFQQGISGVVMSMILGFFLGCLYFVTGSLLLSIILHILFDAKILYISWRIKEQPAEMSGRL